MQTRNDTTTCTTTTTTATTHQLVTEMRDEASSPLSSTSPLASQPQVEVPVPPPQPMNNDSDGIAAPPPRHKRALRIDMFPNASPQIDESSMQAARRPHAHMFGGGRVLEEEQEQPSRSGGGGASREASVSRVAASINSLHLDGSTKSGSDDMLDSLYGRGRVPQASHASDSLAAAAAASAAPGERTSNPPLRGLGDVWLMSVDGSAQHLEGTASDHEEFLWDVEDEP